MQTLFTPEQLEKPRIREAEKILHTCVHYGFCTNTCPTYVITGDENESPRGRIDLIRAMLEKGGASDPKTVGHIDSCLSCLSCMTTCAVKVDYAHLIDLARAHVEENFSRPPTDRLLRALLVRVLPKPRLFALAISFARAVAPLRPILPRRLGPLFDMLPKRADMHSEIMMPQTFPAEGARRARVCLLTGCVQQVLAAQINRATIRLLNRHGCEVVIAAGSGCCGSLPLHMGYSAQAKAMAAANIDAWSRAGDFDAILVNASGCGTTVKDYGHLLAEDPEVAEAAKAIAFRTRDVTEFIHALGFKPTGVAPYRVVYHDACSLQHVQRVAAQPRALLTKAGFQLVEAPERHFCCGSAGTYNLLQPKMAERLGRRKADHIASATPDLWAAGNIGCLIQIGRFLSLPSAHTVELLDWASGGPTPPGLGSLDEDAVRARSQKMQTDAPTVAGGVFW